MKKFSLSILTIAAITCGLISSVQAASQDPNATVVTIQNLNTTEVYADIRKVIDPLKTNCLPEMKLYPGDIRVVKYGELEQRCQTDTKFLADAYGDTHFIVHTALLANTPGTCTIEHNKFTIKITCVP